MVIGQQKGRDTNKRSAELGMPGRKAIAKRCADGNSREIFPADHTLVDTPRYPVSMPRSVDRPRPSPLTFAKCRGWVPVMW